MHVKLDVATEIQIDSLSDLSKLKILMENLKMKINKSKLARELNVDRRTIDKYLKGYVPTKKRKKSSKIDKYYKVISLCFQRSQNKFFTISESFGST